MIGLGTIINGAAIIGGGLVGLIAGRFLKESIQKIIIIAIGLSVVAMNNLSLVGSVLILCVGVNIIADGKFKIKVANLLPSLIFVVTAAFIPLSLFQG